MAPCRGEEPCLEGGLFRRGQCGTWLWTELNPGSPAGTRCDWLPLLSRAARGSGVAGRNGVRCRELVRNRFAIKKRVFGSWCFYRRWYFYRRYRRERISRYDLAAARLGYGSHETQGKRRLAECVVRVHTRYPCDT